MKPGLLALECLSSPLNLPWARVENFYLFYFIFYGIDREILLISL